MYLELKQKVNDMQTSLEFKNTNQKWIFQINVVLYSVVDVDVSQQCLVRAFPYWCLFLLDGYACLY